MVMRAMFTGVTGLRAESEAITTVGDNIANVNTIGYKKQRVLFEDVLGHSILAGTSSALPGAGVRAGSIQQMFNQGSIQNTGVATDLALNGDGFFTVGGTIEGITGNFFTRAGTFNVNSEGFMVNSQGLNLMGYAANADGTYQASPTAIQVPTAAIQPKVSSELTVTANLDSAATVPTAPWDPQNPALTSNFSTAITVYDSLGQAQNLEVYFRKTGANAWEYHALADGDALAPPQPGLNVEVGTGTMAFNTDGALDTFTQATPISINFAGATAAQAINLNFGTPVSGGGTGLDGITQFAGKSNISSQSQDGYSSGEFSGVAVDGTGVVMGLYTNGEKLPVAKLAIAKFRSNEGLGRAGQNTWIQTRESGVAAMGTASAGGRGAVSAGALESSNVDLAEEFVGLIQHQRSFSANSKTITTADDMLQELIQIKR